MALTIVATSWDTASGTPNPSVRLEVAGIASAASLTIIRTSDGLPVRGADNVPLVGAPTIVVEDWEAHLGESTTYTATTYNVSGVVLETALSGATTPPTGSASFPFWLKRSGTPNSLNFMIGDWSDTSFEPTVLGKYKILGRENPVVFTDVWGARSGSFSMLSVEVPWGHTSDSDLESYLMNGDVFLLQSELGMNIKDMWFVVESLERTGYDRPRVGERMEFTYQVGFQEVDRPPTSGLQVGFGTWGELADDPSLVTWAEVASGWSSWLEVLQAYSTT